MKALAHAGLVLVLAAMKGFLLETIEHEGALEQAKQEHGTVVLDEHGREHGHAAGDSPARAAAPAPEVATKTPATLSRASSARAASASRESGAPMREASINRTTSSSTMAPAAPCLILLGQTARENIYVNPPRFCFLFLFFVRFHPPFCGDGQNGCGGSLLALGGKSEGSHRGAPCAAEEASAASSEA